MDTGAVFAQDGVDVRNAADYQRVLDSRWRFMEVEYDVSFNIGLPAVAGVATVADRYFEKTLVYTHALGKIPFFETDAVSSIGTLQQLDFGFWSSTVGIYADADTVFLRRLISTGGAVAETISGRLRVYNLPILEAYAAPKTFIQSGSSPEANTGIQFLEESGGVSLGDASSIGFSIDTRKKILSVHRHGQVTLSDSLTPPAGVTDAIFHDVGYPPTFLLAQTNIVDPLAVDYDPLIYIGPNMNYIPAKISSDTSYLHFKGIQASFGGTFGYIILKDPVELQQ